MLRSKETLSIRLIEYGSSYGSSKSTICPSMVPFLNASVEAPKCSMSTGSHITSVRPVAESSLTVITTDSATALVISKVNCPVVIIHSEEDNFIPYSNAKKMYRSIVHDSKMMVTIKGDHSTPIISERQLKAIFDFADIDTRVCTPNRTHQLLDDVFTVAKRKGLME